MRVCFVSTYPPQRCGLAHYSRNLARTIARLDSKSPSLIVLGERREWIRNNSFRDGRVTVERVWRRRGAGSWILASTRIIRFKPQVVHVQHEYGLFGAWMGLPCLIFLAVARFLGSKVVVTLHSVCPSNSRSIGGRLSSLRTRSAVRITNQGMKLLAHMFVCHTETQRKWLIEVHGFDPRAIELIPHGSNPEVPSNGSKSNQPLLLFFGYISRRKGIHILLRSMPRIKERVPQARLIVAGTYQNKDGSGYLGELHDEAERLGLKGSVDFRTSHFTDEELPSLFSEAQLLVMPYLELFGCSGVLREAARFGKPVVASDLENIRCECSPLRDLILVPPGDPRALADAVVRLLENPSLRKKLGENLRHLACESSWTEIAEKTLKLYSNLVFRPGFPCAMP